jgi:diguanylate cyclase (GGDEF)-like protein
LTGVWQNDFMTTPRAEQDDTAKVAHETGFTQCIFALRRTLATTPAGWALVAWLSWDGVPLRQIQLWLALFLLSWLVCLGVLQWVIKAGPRTDRHASLLFGVAVLDGTAWGLTAWLLMGYDPLLDPWLAAVLCGVSAVNAPVYITYIRAYYALIGSLWLVILLGLTVRADVIKVLNIAVGLTVFFGLIVYYMKTIALRVIEGIHLQLANASLAEQLKVALAAVEIDASTDALTGHANRRALDVLLKQQITLAQTEHRPFAVLMLDIDHFKQVNDTYGHSVGDDALRAFGMRVGEHLRQGDLCARFGGEEFVVILPGTSLDRAMEVAERVRSGVAASDLLAIPPIRVTVSIGVAGHTLGQTMPDLLKMADTAVYAAKRGGRNQVQACTAPGPG